VSFIQDKKKMQIVNDKIIRVIYFMN
jgi:hypothetical protein